MTWQRMSPQSRWHNKQCKKKKKNNNKQKYTKNKGFLCERLLGVGVLLLCSGQSKRSLVFCLIAAFLSLVWAKPFEGLKSVYACIYWGWGEGRGADQKLKSSEFPGNNLTSEDSSKVWSVFEEPFWPIAVELEGWFFTVQRPFRQSFGAHILKTLGHSGPQFAFCSISGQSFGQHFVRKDRVLLVLAILFPWRISWSIRVGLGVQGPRAEHCRVAICAVPAVVMKTSFDLMQSHCPLRTLNHESWSVVGLYLDESRCCCIAFNSNVSCDASQTTWLGYRHKTFVFRHNCRVVRSVLLPVWHVIVQGI